MLRILCSLLVTLVVGCHAAILWWAIDEDGSSPFLLLFFVGWLTFVLWPEPRRVRRRTTRITP